MVCTVAVTAWWVVVLRGATAAAANVAAWRLHRSLPSNEGGLLLIREFLVYNFVDHVIDRHFAVQFLLRQGTHLFALRNCPLLKVWRQLCEKLVARLCRRYLQFGILKGVEFGLIACAKGVYAAAVEVVVFPVQIELIFF
jgi:hypothetical protein